MKDSFGRTIDYLRVSVTDRCNFRCVYCMPEAGADICSREELLTVDEIYKLVKIGTDLGIRKVRLTGGEPLVRKDILEIVKAIASIPQIEDISMTTNGYLLQRYAHELKAAGLNRINISLDTLREDRFVKIARRGNLTETLEGIKAAQDAGLTPIKINCVVLKGDNDDEAVDFAKWSLKENVHIRFIELMPILWNSDENLPLPNSKVYAKFDTGTPQLFRLNIIQPSSMLSDSDLRKRFIPSSKIRNLITAEFGELLHTEIITNGPARNYKLADAKGTIGFISQISSDLCANCNRLRLSADGFLRPCLMADGEADLRTPLRSGCSTDEIKNIWRSVVEHKPARHYLAEGQQVLGRAMSQIGG